MVLFIIGITVPQGPLDPDAVFAFQKRNQTLSIPLVIFGLFDVYHSNLFYFLLGLFLGNLLACTIKTLVEKRRQFNRPLSGEGGKYWGFAILHLSMILLVVFIFVDRGFENHGLLLVKEGEVFRGQKHFFRDGRYYPGPLSERSAESGPAMDFSVFFQKLHVAYTGKWRTEVSFRVRIKNREGRIKSERIGRNHPLEYDGFTFTLNDYGFAPHIIVKRRRDDGIVINGPGILPPVGKKNPLRGNDFPLVDDLVLSVEIIPNATEIDFKTFLVKNSGEALGNSYFFLALRKQGKLIEKKLLPFKRGASKPAFTDLGEYTVGISRLDYWATIYLHENPALYWVYFSLIMCFIGFVLIYVHVIIDRSGEKSE